MTLKSRIQKFSLSNADLKKPETAIETTPVEAKEPVKQYESLHFDLLTDQEVLYKDIVYEKLMQLLELSQVVKLGEEEARKQISMIARRILEEDGLPISPKSRQIIVSELLNDILGLGPLEHLLYDQTISDILVNGAKKIFVERFGILEKTPVTFRDDEHLLKIIHRIVAQVGRRIDESCPYADARLLDGSRVNAIIPPLSLDGPSMSIRRFSKNKKELHDMVKFGSISPEMAEIFAYMLKARLNILVSGGTGSGKTTMLNALANNIPETERVVTIEDSAELQIYLDNLVRLETRIPNIEGNGEVTQRDLVRNALRMRPDRVIIGEVRGQEAFDMLQAMNTGHDGSLATIHANTPRDAISRVESMVTMSGFDLPIKTIRTQIASAINVVMQLERMEDGSRRVVSVCEVTGMEGEIITMSEIFKFDRKGVDEFGNVVGNFVTTGIVPRFNERMKKRGIIVNYDLYSESKTPG